jgi:hypothetical protein
VIFEHLFGNRPGTQFSRGEKKEGPEQAIFVEFPHEQAETSAVAPPFFLQVFAVHGMRVNGDILRQDILKDQDSPLHVVTRSYQFNGTDVLPDN